MIKKILFLINDKISLIKINFYYLIIAILDIFGISYIAILLNKLFLKNESFEKIKFIYFLENYNLSIIIYAVITIFLLKLIVYVWAQLEILNFVINTSKKLRLKILEKILMNTYIQNLSHSEYIGLFQQKVDTFSNDIVQSITKLLGNIVILCFLIAYLLHVNYEITLFIVCFFVFISTFYVLFFRKFIQKISSKLFFEVNNIFKILLNVISNSIEIKIYQKGLYFIEYAKKVLHNYQKLYLKFSFLQLLPRQIVEFLLIGFFLISLLYFNESILNNKSKYFFEFSIFFMVGLRIMPSFLFIINTFNSLNFGKKIVNEIFNLINIKKIEKKKSKIKINKIEFQNVYFKYKNENILKKINFSIKKGESICICGQSGSGKTTILKLLLGINKASSGKILINNKNIKNLNLDDFWNLISYVNQDSLIIDGTIIENISFSSGLSKEIKFKIQKICKILEIEYLLKKSIKVENLSGGEKQRIIIARALFFDRELLILDESTNSIDKKIETKILKYIFTSNKTLIIVSHDPKIISKCKIKFNIEQ